MRPQRRTRSPADPVAVAISTLSPSEREILLRGVLAGAVLAEISKRTGVPLPPLADSAAGESLRAALMKLVSSARPRNRGRSSALRTRCTVGRKRDQPAE